MSERRVIFGLEMFKTILFLVKTTKEQKGKFGSKMTQITAHTGQKYEHF